MCTMTQEVGSSKHKEKMQLWAECKPCSKRLKIKYVTDNERTVYENTKRHILTEDMEIKRIFSMMVPRAVTSSRDDVVKALFASLVTLQSILVKLVTIKIL